MGLRRRHLQKQTQLTRAQRARLVCHAAGDRGIAGDATHRRLLPLVPPRTTPPIAHLHSFPAVEGPSTHEASRQGNQQVPDDQATSKTRVAGATKHVARALDAPTPARGDMRARKGTDGGKGCRARGCGRAPENLLLARALAFLVANHEGAAFLGLLDQLLFPLAYSARRVSKERPHRTSAPGHSCTRT
jgi:hypothetical protein